MTEENEKLFCYRHPDRETVLRCNRCDQPICTSCAVRTPTGYRCRECVRSQQKTYETAVTSDYVVAALISGVLAFLGSLVVSRLGFFTLLAAPFVGMIIAEAVRAAVKRRRSKMLFQITTAATVLGSLGSLLPAVLGLVFLLVSGEPQAAISIIWSVIWPGIYTFLVGSAVYYRLSGIQIR